MEMFTATVILLQYLLFNIDTIHRSCRRNVSIDIIHLSLALFNIDTNSSFNMILQYYILQYLSISIFIMVRCVLSSLIKHKAREMHMSRKMFVFILHLCLLNSNGIFCFPMYTPLDSLIIFSEVFRAPVVLHRTIKSNGP